MNKYIWLVWPLLLLVGCTNISVRKTNSAPEELLAISSLNRGDALVRQKEDTGHLRMGAIRETALSLGARSALAWRVKQINNALMSRSKQLDAVFDFNSLLLKDNIVPPVLVESRNSLNVESEHSIRIADRSYRIIKQARFATAAPIWQNYLLSYSAMPKMPDASLLPKNRKESRYWRDYIRQGWEQGIKQANQIYEESLNRLKRDYQGMIRYRVLLAQNMISSPKVAHRALGVTGGGEDMTVNDRLLTINALPSLQADTGKWLPAVTR